MKKQIGVIGLGKFGLKIGKTLFALKHEVLGIDCDDQRVNLARKHFTEVFQADAMNIEALRQMRIQDLQHVVVSVGNSISVSAMVTMYLKELGVKKVWAKAVNSNHEKLLYKIGADHVIIPEYMAAKQVANKIIIPGFIEFLPFDPSMAVKELVVDKWKGKCLRELDLTNRFRIQVIAICSQKGGDWYYIPKADYVFEKDDKVIAIGRMEDFKRIQA